MSVGHIIAIGGGGFGRNPKHNKIEKYILEQANKANPRIVFVPTASGEDDRYIVNFYKCFSNLDCNPEHIKFFERTPRLDGIINKADIIYVGGGNTKSMLGVWREWKFDNLLHKAYKRGKVLCGVSAGAICWFKQGVTDSWASNLNVLNCLGFIDGMACPHYQEEKDRRPSVHSLLIKDKIKSGYAIDGGAAIHFVDGNYKDSLQFYKNSNVYHVSNQNGEVKENIMKMRIL
tara:strand:+ start:136 stop:831 length:696 start_codon:yes stop_codon:yes gene_type:complete